MKTVISLLSYVPLSNARIQAGAAAEARCLGLGMLHDPNFDWTQVGSLAELGEGLLLARNPDPEQWPQGVAWVSTSLPGGGGRTVIPDPAAAAKQAAAHFREQGLKAMACYRNLNPAEPEHAALEEAFAAEGGAVSVFRNGKHVKPKWTLLGHLRDLEEWVCTLPRPVGILCGDEDHATRLLRVLNRMERRVPEEVALLVYGMDLSHDSALGLSGIDPDYEAVGAAALRALAERMDGSCSPELLTKIPPKGLRTDVSSDRRFSQHPAVRRVIQAQERNGHQRRNVEVIARELGISKSTLNLAFREATGRSIAEELRRRRLDHAVHLLRTSDRQITEIAFDLGYEQSAHFSRDIKAFTGRTPKQVRS
jgi:LacI family transcriptional regulator